MVENFEEFKLLETSPVEQLEPIHYTPSAKKEEVKEELVKEEEVNEEKQHGNKLRGCFIPKNYEVNAGGAFGFINLHYETQKGEPRTLPVTNCHAMVTGIFNSVDSSNELVEIEFIAPSTNGNAVWKTIRVPFEAIKTVEGFKKHIIPEGFSTSGRAINEAIDYFTGCINVNYGKKDSAFKHGVVYDCSGWKDEACTIFVSGARVFRETKNGIVEEIGIYNNVEGIPIDKKLKTIGDAQVWANTVKEFIRYPAVRFACYKAMDTTMLKVIRAKPCTVGFMERSSTGKTFTTQLAASQIGNPMDNGQGIIINGDISVTALVGNLRAYPDHPVFVDESTAMREEVKRIIGYIATNCQEPSRGKQTGGVREQKPLMSNVFLTSENEILSDRVNDGANARAIISRHAPMPKYENPQLIMEAKDTISQNYGHILKLFLEKVFIYRPMLVDWFKASTKRLQDTVQDSRAKRQAEYYATAEVAGKLLEMVYADLGIEKMNPEDIINTVWSECVVNSEERPLHIKALEFAYNFYLQNANSHFFKDEIVKNSDNDNITKSDIYGWIEEDYIDFNSEKLSDAMKKAEFKEPNTIYKHWTTEGITDTDKKGNKKTAWHWVSKTDYECGCVIRIPRQQFVKHLFNNEKTPSRTPEQEATLKTLWSF